MQEAFAVWLKPVRNLSTKVEIDGQKRIIPLVCLGKAGKHSVSDSLLLFFNLHPMPFTSQSLQFGSDHCNCRLLSNTKRRVIDRRVYIFLQDAMGKSLMSAAEEKARTSWPGPLRQEIA